MSELKQTYEWAIIGAGPGGITALGELLDLGINPQDILWVDPEFKVGDFGTAWSTVPSNTTVNYFTQYLAACKSFEFSLDNSEFELCNMTPNATCDLGVMAAPLQAITETLLGKVDHVNTHVHELVHDQNKWSLQTDAKETFQASKVILATGSEPLRLSHPGISEIPLAHAMVTERIAEHCNHNSKIAVFGSSHSAILAIKNLINFGVEQVINFYRSPLRYALPMHDFTLYDNTGLKASTAAWARNNIDGTLPDNLLRVHSHQENIDQYLIDCDFVVYAVGFEKRHSPFIKSIPEIKHDPRTGIIAPGLFGLGIAFPELITNPLGLEENNVGLWKFMCYAKRVMPYWLKY